MPAAADLPVLEALPHGVYAVDDLRRVTYWNPAATRITGYPAEEVLGRPCDAGLLEHVDDRGNPMCATGCPLRRALTDGREHTVRAWLHHRAGHLVPVRMTVAPVPGPDGSPAGAVVAFVDDSARLDVERRLEEAERLALLDPLTGLGNRRGMDAAVRRRFAEWHRHRRAFGLLMCDLDDFKRVNDTHGHDVGDVVLAVVGRSLEHAVRAGDEVFRLGGDEYAVLTGPVGADELERLAYRLVMVAAAGRYPADLRVTLSVGAAMVRDPDDVADLLRRADRRLLAAKRAAGRVERLEA